MTPIFPVYGQMSRKTYLRRIIELGQLTVDAYTVRRGCSGHVMLAEYSRNLLVKDVHLTQQLTAPITVVVSRERT